MGMAPASPALHQEIKMNNNPHYWVVGITLGGTSARKSFLDRGYWQLGTNSKPQTDILYMDRISKIKAGDRIALKSLGGKGSALIKVHAIGIVKDVVAPERRVYIEWMSTDMTRDVDLNGCMDAINGPYTLEGKNKDWVNEIFRI